MGQDRPGKPVVAQRCEAVENHARHKPDPLAHRQPDAVRRSGRVVSDRDSPRSMVASSSTRASSLVRAVIVVAVRLAETSLRIVHW